MEKSSPTYQRLLSLPLEGSKSIFLFGPRGTGKSTWLAQHVENAVLINLLQSRTYKKLLNDPQSLENLIPTSFKNWIIIDEVQKIPELLNEVHRLIEDKGYRFILTGSSARALRKKGVNLLAGRALTYTMHPMIYQEFSKDFDLQHAMTYGLLPNACTITNAEEAEDYLSAYIETYLREEVLQEGLTRNIGHFSRFLEVASFSQGSQINYSAIAREAMINQKVVINYFSILEDLLIAFFLEPFTHRAKRKLTTHRKLYYFDVGVYRHLRPQGPLDSVEEISGAGLETLFVQHVRALNDYLKLQYKIYFWRTENGLEIDFIVYGERGLLAFEIKHRKVVTTKDFKALRAFQEDYPIAKLYIIYGGNEIEYHGAITVIPFQKALTMLPDILLTHTLGAPS